MLTLEQYKIIVELIDNTPLHGTIHTLPPLLSKLVQLRANVQGIIEEMEYVPRESYPEFAPPNQA